jgi:zinc transport system ATP-binding protein
MIIDIKNLSFGYDQMPILHNVNLQISRGEFMGIFGPNGGGKTTLLKLLLGFLKPDAGTIELLGASPKGARKHLGYVPQAARVDKQFPVSVLDLVLMGCLSKCSWWGGLPKEEKRKAEEALEKVGLADKAHVAFGTLSGGQAQRALIARAIVNAPQILILDEPTASIDPAAEAEIYKLLAELKRNMTILMVTHDLEAVLQQVDRLFYVHREVTPLLPKDVCEHFAIGLYHSPLIRKLQS